MKIRSSFVSNSSSSSFVVVGYMLDDNKQTKILLVDTLENLTGEVLDHEKMTRDEMDNKFCDLGFDFSGLYDEKDKTFVGVMLADNDGCSEDTKTPFLSVVSKVGELTDALGVRQEPEIISGTRMC